MRRKVARMTTHVGDRSRSCVRAVSRPWASVGKRVCRGRPPSEGAFQIQSALRVHSLKSCGHAFPQRRVWYKLLPLARMRILRANWVANRRALRAMQRIPETHHRGPVRVAALLSVTLLRVPAVTATRTLTRARCRLRRECERQLLRQALPTTVMRKYRSPHMQRMLAGDDNSDESSSDTENDSQLCMSDMACNT